MKSDIIWPNEVLGENAAAVAWLNRLLRACKAAAIHDVKLVGGTAKIQNGSLILSMNPGSSAVAGGWNYRGLYNPATTYATNDVVSLGTGTSAGMYLSLIDANTNAPDSGIGWVQISTSAGTWL